MQDDATRPWNFFTALYYKTNALLWRLVRDPKQLKTSYIGTTFYRTADGNLVLFKFGADVRRAWRGPHLARRAHGSRSRPARVVLKKSFNADERDGFNRVLSAWHGLCRPDFCVEDVRAPQRAATAI